MTALQRISSAFPRFLYKSRKTVLLIVITAAITLISSVLISSWLTESHNVAIHSTVTINRAGVETYGGDIKYVNGLPSLDWGTIGFGDSKNVSIYLRSTGNFPTTLALNATDWTPEGIKNYVTLSWNYDGTQLAPGEELPVNLTLITHGTEDFANYLVSNNVNSFNFTVNVYALDG